MPTGGIAAVKLLAEGGRRRAATASQICGDGASGVKEQSERGLKALGVKLLARIHHMSVMGHDPVIMLEEAAGNEARFLDKAGMRIGRSTSTKSSTKRRARAGAACFLASGARRGSGAPERERAVPSRWATRSALPAPSS